MPQDASQDFSLDFTVEGTDYDPLADLSPDESESPFADAAPAQAEAPTYAADARSAQERIEDLFNDMAQRRRVLLGILAFLADEPQAAEDVKAEVDRMQEYDYSVYSSANYTSLLEYAGAIAKVNIDGTPFDEDAEAEPYEVEEDGETYLVPSEPLEVYWAITEDGRAYLEADKPLERLYALLDEDAVYRPIYLRVLKLCSAPDGISAAALSPLVDGDPLLTKPRLYVAHFLDKLEKCGALVWEGTWKVTEIGKQGIERLAQAEESTEE